MIYRLKQVRDALWGKLEPQDKKLVDKILTVEEKSYFYSLSLADQYHSIKVAKEAISIANVRNLNLDQNVIIRAGLLHDIGKSGFKITLIDRSLPVIITKISPILSKKIASWGNGELIILRGFYLYWNHYQLGVQIAEKLNLESNLRQVIKYHQEPVKAEDQLLLRLIKEADELC
ncbi:putative nucleotidyltransferase with HDIG domain [Desulfitispora alkaliphila]|uniref:HDIG domain-containing metalloprotein n=1 Tax=Desulfitispora alkaliphila TaxID=622674 RepID=UPI003D1D666C